ncbi:MAG: hypothetical protein J6Y87_05495, partial [Muribaculaceae bacterium]|nr:hypothetical protein [Muribaculaceae bacterium]
LMSQVFRILMPTLRRGQLTNLFYFSKFVVIITLAAKRSSKKNFPRFLVKNSNIVVNLLSKGLLPSLHD